MPSPIKKGHTGGLVVALENPYTAFGGMALELAEVQEADLPELARLAVKTWGASTEGLSRHALPLHDPIVMYPWRLRQLVEGFKKDFTKHFKIVDASKGIIVSYASWEHPHQTPSKEASQGGISDSDIPDTFFPAGSNIQMIKDFYNELDRFKAKYVDQTQDYCE